MSRLPSDPSRSKQPPARARRPYPEISVSSVIFAITLGAIMNAAITYAGLKIGFTIVGSAIAAVLGFGVLRGILRRGTILETNIAQTIASAVNTTNAGIIFTVPALMLMGHTLDFRDKDFWWITLAGTAGALLGVIFIVPLRKQMLDIDRLRFPSATAVAAILKSPGAGPKKSVVLLIGVIVAMLLYLPVGLPGMRFEASLEELDALVARERITQSDAALTRRIAEWVASQSAPAVVIEQGRLQTQIRDIREQKLPDDETEARVQPLQDQIAALPSTERVPPALALAVHEASQGKRSWESLKNKDFGWAARTLWGYQDMGIRLRDPGTDIPRDPTRDPIHDRYDRNRDGRPDLVILDDRIDVGRMLGLPGELQLVFAIAPFALGAGYLTGRAGLMVLAGGLLAYFVLNPLAFNMGWMPQTVRDFEAPTYAVGAFNRPLGIGLLLGGALMGIIVALPAITEAMKSVAQAGRTRTGAARDEMGFRSLTLIGLLGMGMMLLAAEFSGTTGAGEGGWLRGLDPWLARAIIVVVAAAWIWFAGIIIAQCTGMTDWSPISGMALLTVVLVMLLAGKHDVISAVMLGAALCVAISCAADMMADLKTGYIVGARPRRQQIVEVFTCVLGPIITMFTLVLIANVNLRQTGVAIGPGTTTVAPQAQALEAVITGVRGGEMPYALYGLGAVCGMLLGLGAFPGLGVLVGLSMYLPVMYIFTYGIGCIANIIVGKVKGRTWAEEWGVPFCAGLIVGEAILQLCINGIVLIRG